MRMPILISLVVCSIHATASDAKWTAGKLRQYCNACHGLGDELRFIFSDNDEDTWNFIFTNTSPKSGKRWAEMIIKVLDWPSDTPPPFDQMMNPPDDDWMPKGQKRLQLAEDIVGTYPARKLMLNSLKGNLQQHLDIQQ